MRYRYYEMEPGIGGGGTASSVLVAKEKGAGMDPMSAGVQAGGQFLAQYMAQRAAEEENKKRLLIEAALAEGKAAQSGADMTRQAFRDLTSDWRYALTGR